MSRATSSFEMAARLETQKAADLRETGLRLLRRVTSYRRDLVIVMVAMTAATFAMALGPAMIGWIIDHRILVESATVRGLIPPLLLLTANYGMQYFGFRYQFYRMGALSGQLMKDLRSEIFAKIQALPIAYFDRNDAGDLMSKLVNDVDILNQFLSQGFSQLVGGVFRMLVFVLVMFFLDWRLSLVILGAVPLILLITTRLATMAKAAFRKSRQSLGDVSSELEEGIAGVRVAQAFNRGEANQERFQELNRANRDANIGAVSISAAFAPVIESLNALATAVLIGLGGWLVLQGHATMGTLVSFLEFSRRFFFPLQEISQQWTVLQGALAGAERTFQMLDEEVTLVDRPEAVAIPPVQGHIRFQNVSFAYNPDEPVLHDISFEVPAGTTCAIVGPTGAGKTTIISLLGRFHDTDSGTVSVDGRDVRTVTQDSLRRQIGVVLQDNFLFTGTIRDNIRYGQLEATDEDIYRAAMQVEADPFILQLPEGYDTEVGERGGTLSQGQRQLVSFARALLADPKILVLDEATASVDTRTEEMIQQALERLLAHRTSVVIAHRLSTIRNADMVLVMDQGRIRERGTHDELIAMGGLYAELYQTQFRGMGQYNGTLPATAQLASGH